MVATATARGPLTPRLTTAPRTAMAATAPPATAMATARGPLRPMPTTAMAVAMDTDTARGPLMLMLTTAMPAMDVATPTARDPLMLVPTTVLATAMAVTAHTTDKLQQTVSKREDTSEIKPKFVWCFQKCQELI